MELTKSWILSFSVLKTRKRCHQFDSCGSRIRAPRRGCQSVAAFLYCLSSHRPSEQTTTVLLVLHPVLTDSGELCLGYFLPRSLLKDKEQSISQYTSVSAWPVLHAKRHGTTSLWVLMKSVDLSNLPMHSYNKATGLKKILCAKKVPITASFLWRHFQGWKSEFLLQIISNSARWENYWLISQITV